MILKDYLQKNRLIADGAFGTYYISLYADGSRAETGLTAGNMPELANCLAPERVVKIHREYIEAGARLIRTNTFASNTKKSGGRFGCCKGKYSDGCSVCKKKRWTKPDADCRSQQKRKMRERTYRKKEQDVYIVGDIGPIPVEGAPDMQKAYGRIYRNRRDVFKKRASISCYLKRFRNWK